MKPLLLILFTVFALSLAVSAQENIEFDVNGVKIETTEAEVIQKLGKPSSRKKGGKVPCSDGTDFFLMLRYPGLVIELEDSDSNGTSVVATATVTSRKWSVSGIKIGASVSEVKKKFRLRDAEKKRGLIYWRYDNGDGGGDFVFRKGKLIKIYWEFNFC